jgi:hypothetical protein
LRNDGLTWQQIGDKIGITGNSVRFFVELHKPELLNEKILNDQQSARLQLITDLRNDGLTWQQIGDKIGITGNSVHKFVAIHNPQLLKIKNKSPN